MIKEYKNNYNFLVLCKENLMVWDASIKIRNLIAEENYNYLIYK